MKINDRPLWYDVYRAFPPESPPYYAKPAPSIKVLNIFYPEDPFRALVSRYYEAALILIIRLIDYVFHVTANFIKRHTGDCHSSI